MNAQMADEHVFVDSTVVKKPASANKDPNEIRMKFPPSIAAKDLILKPIDGKKPRRSPNAFIIYRKLFVQTARANGYNLQMTEISKTASKSWENEADYVKKYYKRLAKEAYKYRSEMFPKTDRRKKRQQWNIVSFKSTSEEPESNNDTDSSSPSISNQSPLFLSPKSPTWSNEELNDWSSPELSTINEFNEIGEINEFYSPINILHNDLYYDETINQNSFEIDTNTCINYNNEMNSNHPLWYQSGNFPMVLTEEQNHNSFLLF
ncbi:19858_t:CDS:2 [Gigaspora margarita]|uniref:19858_t:CDS:1 n=1 Tax=Gigaspora margarita TaxID=4874 RepID=A0ABM8W5W6_GIGMA|nr:19858_t:CDS:2 [Gigaspora margarita]